MTLDIEPVVDHKNLKPSLTVMGVGGAGSNGQQYDPIKFKQC